MARFIVTALFLANALASPLASSLEARNGDNFLCEWVDEIITLMHEQSVATPFCSTLLHISTVTKTETCTSTPPVKTITTTVSSTDVVTSTSISTVSGITTVYPNVAVNVTSTCALGATVIPTASSDGAQNAKRNYGWPPTSTALGTPTCLTKYPNPTLSSACSCLNIPTPTKVTVTTITLPTATSTKVIASTISSTVHVTTTSTLFTSTYSATQYYTNTFTILPSPSSTLSLPDGEVYGVYPDLDFAGLDIISFNCFPNGPPPPSPYPSCASFADCVAECGFYNDKKEGAATGTTCGAVVFNAPANLSSGYCYLKTGETGCGAPNPLVTTGVLLPLQANDVQ